MISLRKPLRNQLSSCAEPREVMLTMIRDESLFDALFAHTSDKVILLSREKKIVDITSAFLLCHALQKKNIIGRSFKDFCEQIAYEYPLEVDEKHQETQDWIIHHLTGEIKYLCIGKDRKQESFEQIKQENQAKTEFITNISHDLRTPLTGILGLAQSLKDDSENAKHKDDADLLIDTTTELLNLLNEAIQAINLKSGYVAPNQEVFSIKALCQHNISLLKSAAKHKNLNLELTIQNDVPSNVSGNRLFLDRTLLNLLSNAIKFTDQGQVKLVVSVDSMQEEMVWIKFNIADTGKGFNATQKSKIFTQDHECVQINQGIYQSSGLGLNAVKRYMQALKGTIQIESQALGTTVSITVPLKIQQASYSAEIFGKRNIVTLLKSILLSESNSLQNPQATILIIEENDLGARMLRQILYRCHCASTLASTEEEAMTILEQGQFDLLLINIEMPDVNFIKFLQTIRLIPQHKNIPVVALTDSLSAQKEQSYLQLGIHDLLLKPVVSKKVKRLLEKYVFNKNKVQNAPSIDLNDGANYAGGSIQAAKDILKMLNESLPDEIKKLKQAMHDFNYSEMHRTVHKLYGGLCYCGTPRLRELARQLEQALHEKSYDNIPDLVVSLCNEADIVLQEIEKL